MKKIFYLFVMALTVVALSLPSNALALSCVEPPEPLISFNQADTVLIGTVTEIKDSSILVTNRYKTVSLDVKEVFQGTSVTELEIREDFTCGQSEVGKTYLYYLSKEGSHLVNPLCSATTTDLEEANAFTNVKEAFALEPVVESELALDSIEEDSEGINLDYLIGFILGATLTLVVCIIFVRSLRKKL